MPEGHRTRDNVISINMDSKCVECGEPGALPSRFCMDCATSTLKFTIPSIHDFEGNNTEFLIAPELAEIGRHLINNYDQDFLGLYELGGDVDYLWKKKGGTKDGQDRLAQIKKPSAELLFYSKKDYI